MNFTRWLVPQIDRRSWPLAVKSALAGCAIFGCYGIVLDQITFSISQEYFTVLKFDQFAWADPGLTNPRWFVGVIGFIAAGGGGAVSAWILARVVISAKKQVPLRDTVRSFLLCPGLALLFAPLGFLCGRFFPLPESWLLWMTEMGVTNSRAFADVGMIHNFSYLGAIIGLVTGAAFLYKKAGGA